MTKIKQIDRNMETSDRLTKLLQAECDRTNNRVKNLLNDGYNCTKCNNRGFTAEIIDGAVRYVDCYCIPLRNNMNRAQKSGLSAVLKKYSLDNYKVSSEWQGKIKKSAYEFLENKRGWFFIAGQSGAGKTHICTGICRELIKAGYQVKYMLWLDDVYKIKKFDEEAENLREYLKNIEVLYIDDFFKTDKSEVPSSADVRIAMEILNFRYINNKMTIISTEKNITEIFNIDVAVGGRIAEMSKENIINIKNEKEKNYRLNFV